MSSSPSPRKHGRYDLTPYTLPAPSVPGNTRKVTGAPRNRWLYRDPSCATAQIPKYTRSVVASGRGSRSPMPRFIQGWVGGAETLPHYMCADLDAAAGGRRGFACAVTRHVALRACTGVEAADAF